MLILILWAKYSNKVSRFLCIFSGQCWQCITLVPNYGIDMTVTRASIPDDTGHISTVLLLYIYIVPRNKNKRHLKAKPVRGLPKNDWNQKQGCRNYYTLAWIYPRWVEKPFNESEPWSCHCQVIHHFAFWNDDLNEWMKDSSFCPLQWWFEWMNKPRRMYIYVVHKNFHTKPCMFTLTVLYLNSSDFLITREEITCCSVVCSAL